MRDVEPLHSEIESAYRGKHLFVTGATGFLGKVWLSMVLDRLPEIGRVTLLIRGKKGDPAEARFRRIFESSPAFRPIRTRLGQELRTLVREKIVVVDGQITEPWAGMGEEKAREVLADVDAVVHFAGLTDFEPEPQHAIDANIHGAQHAADLAALTPSKRYVHVSTTFVAGMRSGEHAEHLVRGVSPTGKRFDPEAVLAEIEEGLRARGTKRDRVDFANERAHALGWPNVYTLTKALSEHLLEGRRDVKTTTFRPAIVECAKSYPFAGWNEGVNTSAPIVWLVSTSFQRVPAKSSLTFDVVPVDTVARSMILVTALALRDAAEPIYQCASGHLNPLRFDRAMGLTTIAVRRMYDKDEDWWIRNVVSRMDSFSTDTPDREQLLGYRRMRQAARAMRSFLRDFSLKDNLPPKLYERIDGEKIEEELRSFSMKCRTTDRKLGQVDEMLRQYRPFIYEYSYTFLTQNLKDATEALSPSDRALYGFDIEELDWRHYWVKVQVPGLDRWSLPLLRGDKVPEDEPLPPARETGEFATPAPSELEAASA